MARNPQRRGGLGLSPGLIDQVDWDLAVRRVVNDLRTDFIWSPHLLYLLRNCSDELISSLCGKLRAGTFYPGVPLTIEVPKSFRIEVGRTIKRRGPNFSRPGSVLPIEDRVLYQAIADTAAPILEAATDRDRSFSHQLAPEENDSMFLNNRLCWSQMQQRMRQHSEDRSLRYVMRLDIADYFGSINQHTLVNMLRDQAINRNLVDRLEELLVAYTGERSSRGILQGIYPSDLFGAFYMTPIDRFCAENEITSVRYVDDLYLFVPSVAQADMALRGLTQELRKFDLRINEAKSKILLKTDLFTEEPDLEDLFSDALIEVASQGEEEEVSEEGYGFQTPWDNDEDEDEADERDEDSADDGGRELEATKRLFDAIETYEGHEENIERFCLPLFSKTSSDYAVEHVMQSFSDRPSMTQIYCSYLGKFIRARPDVSDFMAESLDDDSLFDWQKIWMIACLHQARDRQEDAVRTANAILQDGSAHEALRAVAGTYVGRMGDAARRRGLYATYSTVTPYIQYALYYSSRRWPAAERRHAKATWGVQGDLNRMYTDSLS